jgi:hypothetical protein
MASAAGQTIEGKNTIRGSQGKLRMLGAPVAGTNEVQTLTIGGTPTGGTFNLSLNGFTSLAIPWNATNATLLASIQAALDAFKPFGAIASQVVATAGTLAAGIGTVLLTFSGVNAAARSWPAALGAVNNLTGAAPTLAVAITTAGVDVSFLGASTGQLLVDITPSTGEIYQNTGVPSLPVWTKVGAES